MDREKKESCLFFFWFSGFLSVTLCSFLLFVGVFVEEETLFFIKSLRFLVTPEVTRK